MPDRSPKETLGFFSLIWARFRLAWRLFRDPRTPLWPKILIPAAMLAYLVFPMDFLPDITPFVGQLDDLTIIALGLQVFVSACPKLLAEEHLARILAERDAPASQTGEVIEGEYTVKKD